MAKRSVKIRDQVNRSAREVRVLESYIEEAHEAMIRVLQLWPAEVEGGFTFRLRATQIKRSILQVWEDLNQLCLDMGFPHTVAPKGGD